MSFAANAGVALEMPQDTGDVGQLARLRCDGRTAEALPLPPDASAVDPREETLTVTWALATLGAGVYQAAFVPRYEERNYWLGVEETEAGPALSWLTDDPYEAVDRLLDHWMDTCDQSARASWDAEDALTLRLPAPVAR